MPQDELELEPLSNLDFKQDSGTAVNSSSDPLQTLLRESSIQSGDRSILLLLLWHSENRSGLHSNALSLQGP